MANDAEVGAITKDFLPAGEPELFPGQLQNLVVSLFN
jgi:hypothetical protein